MKEGEGKRVGGGGDGVGRGGNRRGEGGWVREKKMSTMYKGMEYEPNK